MRKLIHFKAIGFLMFIFLFICLDTSSAQDSKRGETFEEKYKKCQLQLEKCQDDYKALKAKLKKINSDLENNQEDFDYFNVIIVEKEAQLNELKRMYTDLISTLSIGDTAKIEFVLSEKNWMSAEKYKDYKKSKYRQRIKLVESANDQKKSYYFSQFETLLLKNCDLNVDATISRFEASKIIRLNIDYSNIITGFVSKIKLAHPILVKDITGIEYFENLESFDCSNNELSKVDVTKNNKLARLDCENNKISDLRINPFLKELFCKNNKLTSFRLPKGSLIRKLNISNNQIVDSIDLSNGNELLLLIVDDNPLTTIDLSSLSKLEQLDLKTTKLDSIDISHNVQLQSLKIYKANFSRIDFHNNVNLINVSLTNIAELQQVDLRNNPKILRIDLRNNKKLKDLYIDDPRTIKTLNLTGCRGVTIHSKWSKTDWLNSGRYKEDDPTFSFGVKFVKE